MNNTPFIYFSGDSFMDGDELADDTLQCWKDIFGTYSESLDERFHSKFHAAKMKEIYDNSLVDQYLRCQRDRHWTTLVCNRHGIKYRNDGLGGSSQESILHRAVISFDKFEQDGNVPTLAIINLTHPDRVTIYNDSPRKHNWITENKTPDGTWGTFDRTYILSNPIIHQNLRAYDQLEQKYIFAHIDIESEMGNMVRWLNTLAITNSFFKEKTGRYPIYMESNIGFLNRHIKKTEKIASPELQNLIRQARLYTVDSNVWCLGRDQHLLCPGGHHTPQTHVNFARFIEPHLLQELNRKEI